MIWKLIAKLKKRYFIQHSEKDETKEIIEHAKQEHQKVTKMPEELEDMNKNDDQWLKKITRLKEDVQHHIEEDIFKKPKIFFHDHRQKK